MKTYAITKQDVEEHLNDYSPPEDSDQWIIGGKNRFKYFRGKYGKALRKHDPIAFNVHYHENNRQGGGSL